MRYMKPHLVKFGRLINLILALFKYRIYIPIERFDNLIKMLFGRYMEAREANPILLRVTEEKFKSFLRRAEELTDAYLK
ncbi:MAG: hypothetical protein AOA65_0819 [Candidatus Bathyarchaeota archaeon BA1]|nr:MAG: hypothetical protein AOA65_0819 [Candidatus Bathyarchaeota archaeon BA1]